MIEITFPSVPNELVDSSGVFPYGSELHSLQTLQIDFQIPNSRPDTGWLPGHQMFVIRPEDVLNESPLDHVLLYGWRTILRERDSLELGALVRSPESPHSERFVEFNRGLFVNLSLELYRSIRDGQLPELPDYGRFEFRILVAPSLHLFSIWLHSENDEGGAADIIIPVNPLAPVENFLYLPKIISENKISEALRELHDRIDRRNVLPNNGLGEMENLGLDDLEKGLDEDYLTE